MRRQVVPSPLLKFFQQIGSPIGSIILQAVTEYRIRRMVPEGFHQAITNSVKVRLNGSLVIVIEDKSFGADRRTLHRHSGSAGDKEDRHAKLTPFRGNL